MFGNNIERALDAIARAILTAKNDGINFTTTEQDSGAKWIDGKTIFKKTVNVGSLPNTANSATAHGVSGITAVVRYHGIGIASGTYIDMQQGNGVNCYVDATNINIATTIARSQFTGYVTIYYTK